MVLELIVNSGMYGLLELLFGLLMAVLAGVITWFGLPRLRLLSAAAVPSALTVWLIAVGALWFNWEIVEYLTRRASADQRQALIAAHISVGFGLAFVVGVTLVAFGAVVLTVVHVSPNDSDDMPVGVVPLVAGGIIASVLLGFFGAWLACGVTLVATLTLVRLRGRSPAASWMGAVAVAALGMGLGGIHNAMDMAEGFRAVALASPDLKRVVMANHVAGLTGMWAAVAGVIAIAPAAVMLARDRLAFEVVAGALAVVVMSAATLLVESSVTTPMVQMLSPFAADGRLIAEMDDRIALPRVADLAPKPGDSILLRALPDGLLASEHQYGIGFSLYDWTTDGSTVNEEYLDVGGIPQLTTAIVDESLHLHRRGVTGVPVLLWADAQAPWSLLGPVVTTVSRVPDATIAVAVVVPDSHQGVVNLVTTTAPATESFSTSPTAHAVVSPESSTTLDELVAALRVEGVRVQVAAQTMPPVEAEGTGVP